jgi:hypothetical protein
MVLQIPNSRSFRVYIRRDKADGATDDERRVAGVQFKGTRRQSVQGEQRGISRHPTHQSGYTLERCRLTQMRPT